MHEIKFKIVNKSPLIFSSKFGDLNMVYTKNYIPGNTVLGIIVNRFSKKRNPKKDMHTDKQFYDWFLSGQVIFSHAYISENEMCLYPVPFSIQKDKYGDDDAPFFDRLHLSEDDHPGTRYTPKFCNIQGERIVIKDVKKDINFHHARDRIKGIPEFGQIFNYESISPGQIFMGTIKGTETDLRQMIETCGDSWMAHAGRSKNAQYGQIEFSFIHQHPQKIEDPKIEGTSISLTLLSDTILHNQFGFPSLDICDLKKDLPSGIEVTKSFVKNDLIEGFSAKWRLKTPSAPCLKAGSTFLLEISEPCDLDSLKEIQKKGLGERIHEGFGQCKFGLQTQAELKNEDEKKLSPDTKASSSPQKKPEFVSDNIKTIIKKLSKDYLLKQIQHKALKDQQSFVKHSSSNDIDLLPSNSLIAKLGAMAESSTPDSFIKRIKMLRQAAINQLEAFHNNIVSLYDFLLKPHGLDKEHHKPVSQLCDEMAVEKSDYFVDDETIHRVYWQTFFSMMRKHKRNKI